MAAGDPVDLPSGKARLLLAALVVHANQVVSTDRLFEFLWRGQPPDSAANTLQTYVSHLRRSLEPDRVPRQRRRSRHWRRALRGPRLVQLRVLPEDRFLKSPQRRARVDA